MILAILPDREPDDYGSGHFGASRGNRKHNGIDFACVPGTEILAPEDGEVTRLGFPYSDDLSYRYVQITDETGKHHRVFYVEPEVEVGFYCVRGITIIGRAQNISARYTERGKMNNHVHYEIKRNGEYFNPCES